MKSAAPLSFWEPASHGRTASLLARPAKECDSVALNGRRRNDLCANSSSPPRSPRPSRWAGSLPGRHRPRRRLRQSPWPHRIRQSTRRLAAERTSLGGWLALGVRTRGASLLVHTLLRCDSPKALAFRVRLG